MKKPVKRSQARRQPAVTLADLVAAVCRFRDERDWAQFHTPKNLAAATAIEAPEVVTAWDRGRVSREGP